MAEKPNEKSKPELKIVKPSFMEKFKSKNAPTISGIETLLTAIANPQDRRGR